VLFDVTSGDLLLLPSEGNSTLTRTGLVQGLAWGSHNNDESLLLSLHDSRGGLSHSRGIILLPLSDGDLLLVNGEVGGATHHGGGGQRRTLGLGRR
jgi:hypothetical protein